MFGQAETICKSTKKTKYADALSQDCQCACFHLLDAVYRIGKLVVIGAGWHIRGIPVVGIILYLENRGSTAAADDELVVITIFNSIDDKEVIIAIPIGCHHIGDFDDDRCLCYQVVSIFPLLQHGVGIIR